MKHVPFVILAILLLCMGCTTGGDDDLETGTTQYMPAIEDQLFVLTNAYRAANGLNVLELHAGVRNVARNHSLDMAQRDYFNHTSPDGLNAGDRLNQACIAFSAWGENIGLVAGYSDPAQKVMDEWQASAEHRAVLLEPSFTLGGVGVVKTGDFYYFTQVLIRP